MHLRSYPYSFQGGGNTQESKNAFGVFPEEPEWQDLVAGF